jgi:hypothetical protein
LWTTLQLSRNSSLESITTLMLRQKWRRPREPCIRLRLCCCSTRVHRVPRVLPETGLEAWDALVVLCCLCSPRDSPMRTCCSNCGVRQADSELGLCVQCLSNINDDSSTPEIRFSHACSDWDFMVIDETCPEWESCTCFPNSIPERQPK